MTKRQSIIVVLSVLLCLFLVYLPSPSNAQSNSNFVTGQVLDDATNQPINDATVSLWKSVRYSRYSTSWNLIETTKTSVNGHFMIEVDGGYQYELYVYFDDSNSPGFDYTPVSMSFKMPEENVTFSIRLLPAASIRFDGDIWFVESTSPLTYVSYTIEDNITDPSTNFRYVHTYGTSPTGHYFLSFPSNHVVVPIDRKIVIQVSASSSSPTWRYKGERISNSFVINDVEQLNLTQGVLTRVNIEKYSTWVNYDFMMSNLNSSNQLLKEADQKGFHVVVEKQDLAKAENLVGLAKTKLDNDQFEQAYIALREAYLKTTGVNKSLESVYANALASTSLLTLFLSLTALSSSYVLFERLTLKLSIYLIFFTAFFLVFYFAYPGCSLVSTETLLNGVFMSLVVSLLISLIFPRFLKDRFVSTFSLAKRNLRRRKTRFLLTLLTVTVLVMSFVSLTSFSTGYGFTTRRHLQPSNHFPEGLLIQQPEPSESLTLSFFPLEPSSIELLREKPEIQLVAVKAENRPQPISLGFLYAPSTDQRMPFCGVIGFQPSAEADITKIDSIVVEGRYLRDDDEDSILISADLARRMGIEVNSEVTFTHFTVTRDITVIGFFDADRLLSIKDVNGKGFLPSKLIQYEAERTTLTVKTPCEPDEVIIMTLKDAMKSPFIFLSRVDVLIENPQDSPSFAKELALEQGFSVWYSKENAVYEVVVASFLEERGSIIFIPWIIVTLNVVATMLNSIFEYRKEIVTLSAVGLNPTDIMGLFIAEAAIIGVVGGGVGYLLGISNYKLMSMLSIVVEVRPKVSAVWSLASVLVSVSAVLVGAFVALRSSVVITPSMRRRWKAEKETPPIGEPWVFSVPFRLREEELASMFDYVATRFRRHLRDRGIDEGVGEIRYSEDEDLETSTRRIHFNYVLGQKSNIGSFPFQLVAKKGKDEEIYSFEVICKAGTTESMKETVSFVRMSIIEWSANQTRS